MLTADLIRYRIVGDEIRPRYISRHRANTYLDVCRQLLHLFKTHEGKVQHELMSSLEDLEGERTDFKIFRGLAKLLHEDTEFCPKREIDFPDLRHRVFSHAQAYYPIVSKSDLLHETHRRPVP